MRQRKPKTVHPDHETIRIRIDATFDIPKGEFDMDRFNANAAAESIIRSHFPPEWWEGGREVWQLGNAGYKVTNVSLTKEATQKKR